VTKCQKKKGTRVVFCDGGAMVMVKKMVLVILEQNDGISSLNELIFGVGPPHHHYYYY